MSADRPHGLRFTRTRRGWSLVLAFAALLAPPVTRAIAETPAMPLFAPVPQSGQAPLSSAARQGAEYVDLEKAGYVEE